MLQLDEATRGKLLQRLEQLDHKGEDLRRQRHDAILALREQAKSLRSKPDRKGLDPDRSAPGVGINEEALKGALDRIYAVEDALVGFAASDGRLPEISLPPSSRSGSSCTVSNFTRRCVSASSASTELRRAGAAQARSQKSPNKIGRKTGKPS